MAASKKGTSRERLPASIGRPSKYNPSYCDQVVTTMAKGYSLTAFAGKLGVARSTINEWMAQHPEFSEAVSRAKASRLYSWETEALRTARNGGRGGKATMIIFGLKNMGTDEWRDKTEVGHMLDLSMAELLDGMKKRARR